MDSRYMKRLFSIIDIRKMQIKSTGDITLQLSEWLSSRQDNKCQWRCKEKGTLVRCCECKMVQLTIENSIEVSSKNKNSTTIWSSSPNSAGHIQRKPNQYRRDTCIPVSFPHCSQEPSYGNNLIVLYSLIWWMNKEIMVYIYMKGIFTFFKKRKFCYLWQCW